MNDCLLHSLNVTPLETAVFQFGTRQFQCVPTFGTSSHRVVYRGDTRPRFIVQTGFVPNAPSCTAPRPNRALTSSSTFISLRERTLAASSAASSRTFAKPCMPSVRMSACKAFAQNVIEAINACVLIWHTNLGRCCSGPKTRGQDAGRFN